jgi:hypothetical protein
MATVNSGTIPAERIVTIGDFVERVYLPWTTEHKRPSTAKVYRDIREDHLKPLCALVWLKDARTYHIQGWLNQIGGGKLSLNTLKHGECIAPPPCFLLRTFQQRREQAKARNGSWNSRARHWNLQRTAWTVEGDVQRGRV